MSYKSKFTGEQVDEYLTRVEEAGNLLEIKEGLAEKANTDGYYPSMRVGLSDNLPDRRDVIEGEIGFRESAGVGNSIEDGTAEVVELLGDSVVWNNKRNIITSLDNYGYACYNNGNKVVLKNVSASTPDYGNMGIIDGFLPIAGHKYVALTDSNLNLSINSANGFVLATNTIGTAPSLNYTMMYVRTETAPSISVGASVEFNLVIVDLTLMFGVGNEPSSIDDFYARIPQGIDLNSYNEGEVIGVNMKGIKSVNDNAWDEKWEVGSIGGASTNRIRSKNLIRVIGGETYYFYCSSSLGSYLEVAECDANGNRLRAYGVYYNRTKVISKDAHYIIIGTTPEYGNAYNNDICIRLAHSGYKTDYVSHEEDTMVLDTTKYFPNGMHRIGDAKDSLTKNKRTQKIGFADMGKINWSYVAPSSSYPYGFFYSDLNSDLIDKKIGGIPLTAKYAVGNLQTDHCVYPNVSNNLVYVMDSAYTDAASFKSAMAGVMLYYELAEPIETDLDPQLNMSYKVWDFGTEELLCDKPSTNVGVRTIYGFNATDTIRGNKAKINEHEDRIEDIESTMVRKEGYAPELTSGFADNLVGRGESIPAEFSFRASGGKSIEDGSARIKTLNGNAVVWNQLFSMLGTSMESSGVNIKKNADNSITINGTLLSTAFNVGTFESNIENHKYLFIFVGGTALDGKIFALLNRNVTATISNGYAYFFYKNTDTSLQRYIGVKGLQVDDVVNDTIFIRQIDLTKMFGAGNEPTTIEEFYARKPIVEDENLYNEGEVIPFTAEGIKSIGDNAWDGEWEGGDVSGSNGVEMDSTATWRNKGYIRIIPNEYYYIQSGSKSFLRARFYDADKNFIGIVSANNTDIYTNEAFKTASNAHYMRFAPNKSVIAEGTMMCVSLVHSGYKEGKYFPYEQDIRKLDQRIKDEFPNGMMPWDKVYNKNGKGYIVKGTGRVGLGDLDWYQGVGFFASEGVMNIIKSASSYSEKGNMICAKYITDTWARIYNGTTSNAIGVSIDGQIGIIDSAYTDTASFKAAMAGVMLYYELAAPTIIEYDEPFNLDYLVWDFGTEEIIADKPSAPLKADIIYQFNAVDEIRELRQMIATMQAQMASLINKE